MTWVMIFFSGLKKSDAIYSIIIFLRVCWYIFSLFGRLDLRCYSSASLGHHLYSLASLLCTFRKKNMTG